jgi:hypothetical protein
MQNEIDLFAQKRSRLASFDKEQLVDLLANILVTIEALGAGDGNSIASLAATTTGTKVELRVTKAWALILHRLSGYKHFRATDAVLVSREFYKDGKINRIQTGGSARAQLSLLTRKGIIKRLGGGNYLVPDAGKRALEQLRAEKRLGRSRGNSSSPKTAGDAR